MKKLLLLVVIGLSFTGLTFAHPGNTYSNWYHTCYTNCESYGLYYWEYHNHPQTITSYAWYAPAWSCSDEKSNYQSLKQEIDVLAWTIDNVYSDLVEKAKGSWETESYLRAKAQKITDSLIIEYNAKVRTFNSMLDAYDVCMEVAWMKAYDEKVKAYEESIKQIIFDASVQSSKISSIVPSYNDNTELTDAIKWLYDNWLTSYDTVATFMWDDYITREQASKFFVMFAKTKWKQATSIKNNIFTDVKNANPNLYPYICVAYTLWIMNWSNNKFMPFSNLTPAQSLAMLIRITDWKLNEQWANRYSEYYNHANVDWILNGLWFNLLNLDTTNIKRKDMALLLYRSR